MTTRCISCGAVIYEDEVGCSACWAQARAEADIDTERPPANISGKGMRWGLVLGLLAWALVITAALWVTGCTGVQRVVWPIVVQCSQHVGLLVEEVQAVLEQDVNSDELSPEGVAMLEELARRNGAELVTCIIEQLISQWMAPGRLQHDPAHVRAARRGQDFLNAVGSHPVMRE